jgi:hypothetical protein
MSVSPTRRRGQWQTRHHHEARGRATIARMLVEVLTFEGCPHAAGALDLARRVAADTGGTADVRLVYVKHEQTESRRFLGSPSIRVDGRDIEPGADMRRDYAFSCRLYPTAPGLRPLPAEAWLRAAIAFAESS